MALCMSGLDCSRAPIALREQLSFTKTAAAALDQKLAALPGVAGAVVLSTCNRTEVYLSCEGEELDPGALLCRAAGADYGSFAPALTLRRGRTASATCWRSPAPSAPRSWGRTRSSPR